MDILPPIASEYKIPRPARCLIVRITLVASGWAPRNGAFSITANGNIIPMVAPFPLKNCRKHFCRIMNGNFWFGNAKWRSGPDAQWKLSPFYRGRRPGQHSVWSIHEDINGTLWSDTENGLTRWRGEVFQFQATSRSGEHILAIHHEDLRRSVVKNPWLSIAVGR